MDKENIELIYDGKCPICVPCVEAYALREQPERLQKIDARKNNQMLLAEMQAAGMDINKGLVIRYNGTLHYAADAMALLAKLGTNKGTLNYINTTFFRYKPLAVIGYPLLKAVRRAAFIVLRIPMINLISNEPIFKNVFGHVWDAIPEVIRRRYDIKPYSDECITVEGTMDVHYVPFIKLMVLLLRLFGTLVPYTGNNIPVTVHFHSEPESAAFRFDRIFHFTGHKPYHFRSKMFHLKENMIVEYMRFGLGIKFRYEYDGKDTVYLRHAGYVWKIGKWLIPLPIDLLLGEGFGEEIAVTPTSFTMRAGIKHRLFGLIYEYKGSFVIGNTNR